VNMSSSIAHFGKFVKNFFQVGGWGEWFGQVFYNTLLLSENALRFTCGVARAVAL